VAIIPPDAAIGADHKETLQKSALEVAICQEFPFGYFFH
jgi:hypothetical protein